MHEIATRHDATWLGARVRIWKAAVCQPIKAALLHAYVVWTGHHHPLPPISLPFLLINRLIPVLAVASNDAQDIHRSDSRCLFYHDFMSHTAKTTKTVAKKARGKTSKSKEPKLDKDGMHSSRFIAHILTYRAHIGNPKAPSAWTTFLKDNLKAYKDRNPSKSHREAMQEVRRLFVASHGGNRCVWRIAAHTSALAISRYIEPS